MNILERLKTVKNTRGAAAAFILALTGLLLLIFGGTMPKRAPPVPPNPPLAEREALLSARLEELLDQIAGTNGVKVMLTLETGGKTEYAADFTREETRREEDGQKSGSLKTVKNHLLTGTGSSEKPVIISESCPKVRGAAVVCGGAADPAVKAAVIHTVSTVLGIPTSRVCVVKMK